MPARLVVAAAIVDALVRPTRVLAARRTHPAALAGCWELPGGKVEPGETPLEALHRELREELSIEVVVGEELVGPSPTWPLTPGLVMRVWWAVVTQGAGTGGTLLAGEAHDELAWVDAASIGDLAWLEPDLPVVEAIRARLAQPPPEELRD